MLTTLYAWALIGAHALVAHWQIALFLAILFLSLLNKLLPGHPEFSGATRKLVSWLAASPMAGARSSIFAFVAAQVGTGLAAAFFDWLSTWLDIPILSVSVTPEVADSIKPESKLRIFIWAFFVASLVGCSFIHKELGPTVGTDILQCEEAQLVVLEGDVMPDLQSTFATASDDGLAIALAQLEGKAVTQLGSGALAALKCDALKIVADYEAAHAADAGPAPDAPALLVSRDAHMVLASPAALIYQRAKVYAAQ